MGKVLRRLRDRYPSVHAATRRRWRQDPDFPKPDMIAGGTEFYTDEALDAYDARRTARERQRPKPRGPYRKKANTEAATTA